jgi:TonB-linked SusC/RagA family outer membrane protein
MHLTAIFRFASCRNGLTQMLRVMKLTAILLTAAFLQVAATGKTQTVTLDVKNASLEKVFKEIRKQTGFNFLFNSEDLAKATPVTVQVKDRPLNEVLSLCLKDQPLSFVVNDGNIVVKQKRLEIAPSPLGEGVGDEVLIDISGRVTNEKGEPLAGANIKVKSTDKGTTTDANGVFILKRVDEKAELEITYAEYEKQTIPVNSRTSITVVLKQQVNTIQEVVIQKGYYTEKAKYSVGNVTHIDAKVFEQSPVTNPLLALQGRVPGMEITQLTGLNGGGVKVRIQGENSIGFGSDPLIVIDGVPYPINFEGELSRQIIQGGSPLNFISPQDIESIDVLKDADATAIYGSRAANGAILITTKKGKVGRTKVSLNLQQGWGKVAKHMDMLNTRQYLDMRYEAYRNDNIRIGSLTQDFSNYDLTLWDTTRYTDWQKELIGGTAKYTNIQAGISGGNQSVQYLVSANYNKQTTVFPGDFDHKIGGMHFSIGGNSANQRFNIQFSGGYTFSDNHLPREDLTQTAILMVPNAPALYKQDGSLNWAPDAVGNSSWYNPLVYTVNADFINTDKALVSNLTLSYKILPGLIFKTFAGYRNTISEVYIPTRQEAFAPEARTLGNYREAQFGNSTMNGWNIEPQLEFSHKISKGRLNAFLGTTILKTTYNYLLAVGRGFPTDELMKTLKAATSVNIFNSGSSITRFNALFGRLGYIYNEKYLLNFTGRRDGSNKFGEANRFHNFWSAGAGWIFSNENCLHQCLPFLSFGKLRASYGLTGSDNIGEFAYLSQYGITNNSGIPYQGSIALNAQNIPNPHLQWEETRKINFGVDLGFFKDKVTISANFYRNRSSNQLQPYNLPTLTGFNFISKNLPAVVQNTGWELVLNSVIFKNKTFVWNSSINISIPRSARLISYPGIENTSAATLSIGSGNIVVGQPLGITYVYKYAGINSANGRTLILNTSGNPQASTLPSANPATIFLSTQTKYYGGLSNNISYKGVQLDFTFEFIKKVGTRDMYFGNGNVGVGNFEGATSSNQPITVLNRWQKPGDMGTVPRFSSNSNSIGNIPNSDAYYGDASFVRLKNLSLSWQLPAAWISKMHLQGASLYMRGQNLATITNYTGLDPETMGLGMPPLTMWTIGGQFSF